MPSSPPPARPLLRTSQVARALFVTPKTVDNWRRLGHFREHVIELPGPTFRFHAEFVDNVVAGTARLGAAEVAPVLKLVS